MTTERPKRPLTAYLLWLNANREQLKKENPGSKATDIAKIGGELWRAMKDKSEWLAKSIVMKEKYAKDLKKYKANGGTDTVAKRRRTRLVKQAKKIKKRESSEEESDDESD